MKNKILLLSVINVLALSVFADQNINFVRQLSDGVRGTFVSKFFSTRKVGAGKMTWFPAPACWIDSLNTSRTCKVWSIMPLRKIEQDSTLPIWHYAQQPKSHIREQSTRYQIQYLAGLAETNVSCDAGIENVFDIDAGDVFQYFSYDDKGIELLLLRERESDKSNVDSVLCSSGRIAIEENKTILMYGLTVCQDGKCLFSFSTNGMVDISNCLFYIQDEKLYVSPNHPVEDKPNRHTISSRASIWLSDPQTLSLRVSNNYEILGDAKAQNSDIHISLDNLMSLFKWLSQPQEKRGVWIANSTCSLDKRQIF